AVPHGDNHHLWINPANNQYLVNSNDGGANVSLNGGKSWSSQQQQPTAQFYRVITDNQVPYHVYGGQQDNSAIAIASRTNRQGIDWKDWYSVAGCESAYLAFDPDNPAVVYGGCYQGIIEQWVRGTMENKPLKEYPELSLGNVPADFRYRFNWNAPIITSPHDRKTIYHAGNVVFRSQDEGISWEVVSPDLTQNDKSKQGPGGQPFTNEAAGGENYNTLMYLTESGHEQGVLWAGSDDGLVHVTRDGGANWTNVTPPGLPESIINAIEVSPHDPATAYVVAMRYKFNDLKPYAFKTNDYGRTWIKITHGLDDPYSFPRVIREDKKIKGLLYAGTETGLYISLNDGANWQKFQLNLPIVPINDLTIRDNDLIAATAGRSFWILDDLGALQQSKGNLAKLAIYKPKDTYRLFGGSADTPSPGLGQNPKEGVTVDYCLPQAADSADMNLYVLDKSGAVIRTYTNRAPEDFQSWPGGPAKPAVLPAKKGVNRFTWDFQRESLPAVDQVFIYGTHTGSRVGPGDYTLRLVVGQDAVETTVTLLPDPRINVTQAEFDRQQQFLTEVENLFREIHESVSAMRSAKTQLQAYQKLLKDNEAARALTDTAHALVTKIEAWEQRLIQPSQKTFQDVINFHNQLNAELSNLKEYADVADPRLTKGATERLNDVKASWKQFADTRDALIKTDMKAFNDLYKKLGLPAVIME
ncbi:MAG: glycosyl hydrolase, partial [Cyclobacteriaceae bacterium]|nr:glycosyl hydrolase [Cyclobacteriaceae bacterium]